MLRRQEVDLSKMPHEADSPARNFEDAEARRQFQLMVTKMHGKLVANFILLKIEVISVRDCPHPGHPHRDRLDAVAQGTQRILQAGQRPARS